MSEWVVGAWQTGVQRQNDREIGRKTENEKDIENDRERERERKREREGLRLSPRVILRLGEHVATVRVVCELVDHLSSAFVFVVRKELRCFGFLNSRKKERKREKLCVLEGKKREF